MARASVTKISRSTQHLLRRYLIAIVAALGVGMFARSYVVESFRIPTAVMEPTLHEGDLIFVSKWKYSLFYKVPQYGDVVLFRGPRDSKLIYLKRVVGRPGDTVEIRDGQVILNKKVIPIENGYEIHPKGPKYRVSVTAKSGEKLLDSGGPVLVPLNSLYLVGDHRVEGLSKMSYGIVNWNHVSGQATTIWLSLKKSGERRFFEDIH